MNIDDAVSVLCNHLFRNDDKESCQHNQIHLIRIKSAQKIFIKCRTALILLRADAYCLNSVLFCTFQSVCSRIIADHYRNLCICDCFLFNSIDPADVDKTMEAIKAAGDTPYVVGKITDGEKGVTLC